jgi:hypothetical protein
MDPTYAAIPDMVIHEAAEAATRFESQQRRSMFYDGPSGANPFDFGG